MTTLGIDTAESASHSAQVQVGFRAGWLRSLAVRFGGAGLAGLAIAVLTLAQKQPSQVFDLLKGWGWVWILVLAAMLLVWDLAKIGLAYLGRLADSVQDTAVAMNRIADKDDRERDRMITETQFVSQRLQRMADEHVEWKQEQRAHNSRIEQLLTDLKSGSRT